MCVVLFSRVCVILFSAGGGCAAGDGGEVGGGAGASCALIVWWGLGFVERCPRLNCTLQPATTSRIRARTKSALEHHSSSLPFCTTGAERRACSSNASVTAISRSRMRRSSPNPSHKVSAPLAALPVHSTMTEPTTSHTRMPVVRSVRTAETNRPVNRESASISICTLVRCCVS